MRLILIIKNRDYKEPHNGVDAGNGQGGKGSASFDDSSGGYGEDGWVIIEWGWENET